MSFRSFPFAPNSAVPIYSPVANTLAVAQIDMPVAVTLTGVTLAVKAASGNAKVSLYDASGNLLASSASTAVSGSATLQQIAFSSPYAAAAALYFVGVQFSNISSQTLAALALSPSSLIAQGAFTVPASITAPTAPYGSAVQPILSTY